MEYMIILGLSAILNFSFLTHLTMEGVLGMIVMVIGLFLLLKR